MTLLAGLDQRSQKILSEQMQMKMKYGPVSLIYCLLQDALLTQQRSRITDAAPAHCLPVTVSHLCFCQMLCCLCSPRPSPVSHTLTALRATLILTARQVNHSLICDFSKTRPLVLYRRQRLRGPKPRRSADPCERA